MDQSFESKIDNALGLTQVNEIDFESGSSGVDDLTLQKNKSGSSRGASIKPVSHSPFKSDGFKGSEKSNKSKKNKSDRFK